MEEKLGWIRNRTNIRLSFWDTFKMMLGGLLAVDIERITKEEDVNVVKTEAKGTVHWPEWIQTIISFFTKKNHNGMGLLSDDAQNDYYIPQLDALQAMIVFNSGVWKKWSDMDILKFQCFQERLCVSEEAFRNAYDNKIGERPIVHFNDKKWMDLIKEDFLTFYPHPTRKELGKLLPADKAILWGFN